MSRPVRILYVSDTGGKMGGAAVSLTSLIERLDRNEFEPYALLGSDGDFADALRRLDVDVTIAELKPIIRSYNPLMLAKCVSRLGKGCRAVMKVCKEKDIDIIHANDNTVVFFAAVPAALLDKKCAWHVRSPVSKLGKIGAFLVKQCDALVFCSESNAEPFKRHFSMLTEKIFIAYEGVDVEKLRKNADQPSIRQDYDIHEEVPLIGIVGRVARLKGQDEFLKAAVVVSNLFPRARYAIVGEPIAGSRDALSADMAFEREIKVLADRLDISDKVIFTGYRHDAAAVMKDLDVVVVPSRQEGLGLVALEAMALGKPVVVSNIGGLREIVENEVNGLVVPVDAAGALGMAISRLLREPQLAKKLSEAGKQKVEQHYTADAHANTVADVYRVIMRST